MNENVFFASVGIPVFCPAGSLPFLQGDPCVAVGYVATGSLEIRTTTPDGREMQIQTVEAGTFFGDVLLFAGGSSYLGNVVAIRDTEIRMIDREAFLDLLAADRDRLRGYLEELARKTFAVKQQVKLLSLPDLRARILFWLRSRTGGTAGTVAIPGTKERLARELGVERPSLSRELGRMRDAGLIDFSKRDIVLK